MSYKFCPNCQRTQPIDQFPNNASRADGKGGWCKECNKAVTRRWKAKNPEIVVLQNRIYRANQKIRRQENG